MSKRALVVVVAALLLVLAAGCSGVAVSPSPSPAPTTAPTQAPTTPPSPTPSTGTATDTPPPVAVTPSGPASCTVEPLNFPVNDAIPPVTDEDHVEGAADASITFIEYADFQ